MAKNYWLVKQEPESYSWDTFVKEGRTAWTGVRNFQARNNLRAMKKGDLVGYYHSGDEKQVTLATIKGDRVLASMLLAKHSRPSVSPMTVEQFDRLLALGETKP